MTPARRPRNPCTSTHRPDGTLAEQEVVTRDGSSIHSQFSLDPRIAGWNERHTIVLLDGQQITVENNGDTQTIYGADGQPISASEWTSERARAARDGDWQGQTGGGLFSRSAPGSGLVPEKPARASWVPPGPPCSHGSQANTAETARWYWRSRRVTSDSKTKKS